MHDLPRNWLVFRLSALGDVVLTTGVLRHWHERYGWRFHVLTKSAFAPVFANTPFIDRVVTPPEGSLRLPGLTSWFSALATEYKEWGLLDLHGTLRSRLLAFLWKGPVRRYPKHALARRLFLHSGGRLGGETLRKANVPQRYSLAVGGPQPPAASLVPCMYLDEAERHWSKSFLANLFGHDVVKNVPGCVAVHPFASHAHKAWPRERLAAFLEALEAREVPWIILGKGDPLFLGNPRDLTNGTTLRETAALLAACAALVTGDSGPMHMATAVGTPVVAFFGPTTGEWGFFPSGARDTVMEIPLACRPCSLHGKSVCAKNGECLAAIQPDQVLAVLDAMWSGRI